jgi:TetR/AcrR family transcriptional repressor of nem operon
MPRPANPEVRDRLRNAGDLIHRTSFGTTGVHEITATAGVPKGSFYNYFESKEAYAVDLLDTYWRTIDETYGPILRDTSLPPTKAIRGFFIALVGYHSERDFIPGCLIGNLALELAATNEAARGKLRQLFAHWTAGITARLTEARRAEAAPHDSEPEEVAAALIDAFEGAVLRAKVDRSRAALGRFENLVLPLFLRYSFAS